MNTKRLREIQVRLKEIRDELNFSRVHNTEPLSGEKVLSLFGEENALLNEYRALFY